MIQNGVLLGRSLLVDHHVPQLELDRFRKKAVQQARSRGLIVPDQDEHVAIVLAPSEEAFAAAKGAAKL